MAEFIDHQFIYYFLAYLAVLFIVPFAVSLLRDLRTAVAVVFGELKLILVVMLLVMAVSMFVPGIWPHIQISSGAPRADDSGSVILGFGLLLMVLALIPAVATLLGGLAAVIWHVATTAIRRARQRRWAR